MMCGWSGVSVQKKMPSRQGLTPVHFSAEREHFLIVGYDG